MDSGEVRGLFSYNTRDIGVRGTHLGDFSPGCPGYGANPPQPPLPTSSFPDGLTVLGIVLLVLLVFGILIASRRTGKK